AFGVSGRMAKRNSLRNPRRTAATATALMIGLTLMSALGVITTSLKSGIAAAATDGIRADYSIMMTNYQPLDGKVVDSVRAVPGVKAATGDTTAHMRLGGAYRDVDVSDTTMLHDLFNLDTVSGTIDSLGARSIAVDADYAKDHGWK